MADHVDDKTDGVALVARVAELEREVEDLRAMWALNREADERNLIQWENDELLTGKVPTVAFTHEHLAHGAGHACVGTNPMALEAPEVLKALKAHLEGPEGRSPDLSR